MVKVFNYNLIPVRIEQNIAKFCLENSNLKKAFITADRGRTAQFNFL